MGLRRSTGLRAEETGVRVWANIVLTDHGLGVLVCFKLLARGGMESAEAR